MNPVLITTSDGSHSLHVPELNEAYHSTHGALQESLHVFIHAGFDKMPEASMVRILEVGMGTGLNTLLTVWASLRSQRTVHYTAVDTQQLTPAIVSLLNYPDLVGDSRAKEWFDKIHATPWGVETHLTESFTLSKLMLPIQEAGLSTGFDLVYFDAFAPQKQPDMWTPEIFAKLFSVMADGAILVTYCAKGQVKRDLRSVGFEVESLPGPPGKREMIRAHRPNKTRPN